MATIYDGVLTHKTARAIHKQLFDMTINNKVYDAKLFNIMVKMTNKAKKLDKGAGAYYSLGLDVLAVGLLDLFEKEKINSKAKKIINRDLMEESEKEKNKIAVDYIEENRNNGIVFYLASSHNDCAKDHVDYQGKMYVDKMSIKTPEIREYIRKHNIKTLQWVMGNPVWFVTRPYCRHYFVAIPTEQVLHKSVKKLKKRYKTHKTEGNRELQTPAKAAVDEYEDRLKMLEYLYSKFKTQKLRDKILKTKMLLKKWKNNV